MKPDTSHILGEATRRTIRLEEYDYLVETINALETALVRAVGSIHTRGDHVGAWDRCSDPACRHATMALAGYLMDVGSV